MKTKSMTSSFHGQALHLRTAAHLSYLLLFLFLGSISAQAQRYVEITAEIKTSSQWRGSDGKTNDFHRTISLVCTVGTNEWRIDNFLEDIEAKWLFDGTNVFNSSRMMKPIPYSNVTISIGETPDGHPLGDAGVNIPWLAFCSGTYLKRDSRIIPLPIATLRHAPDGFAYSDKTQTFDDESGLPRTVDLFTSKSLYEASIKQEHFLGNHDLKKWRPEAIKEGLLKFHYAVIESTNFMGWNFPLKFEYLQNERWENGDWLPRYRGIGKITSIRAAVKPKNLFAPDLHQTIVDYRFHDAIIYTSTNTYAVPTNDPSFKRISQD